MLHQIIQITDTHLKNTTGAKQMKQQFSPNDKLQLVFDDIEKNNSKAEFIVITGDLIHEGNQTDYKMLRRYLDQQSEKLGMPIYVTLGNHDRTADFYKGYLNQEAKDKCYYKVSSPDYDYYFLDTKHGNIEQGYLSSDQLDWLSNELSKSDKSSIIFMHHPAYGAPLKYMKYSILQNGDEFYDIINGKNVIGVFSGHVHFPTSYNYNGIFNVIGDSTAYHIDCRDPYDHVYCDATSYNVIDIDDNNIGTTLVQLLSDGHGPSNINGHIKVEDIEFLDKGKFK